jgi:hypothetical protein
MSRSNQLIVHEDFELAEQVATTLRQAFGAEADVFIVRNFDEAQRRLDHPNLAWSMIIVGANAPESSSSRRTGDSAAAQDFVLTARRLQPGIPIVALTANEDPEFSGLLKGMDHTALLTCKPGFLTRLETLVNDLRLRRPVRPSLLELEIQMTDDDNGAWFVRRKGRVSESNRGTFAINRKAFTDLVDLSSLIPRAGAAWTNTMDLVCRHVGQLLFEDYDNDLTATFFSQLHEVGGTENIRVLFTMSPSRQNAMVEALRDHKGAKKDYWMLKAPIIRQYSVGRPFEPIFADDVGRKPKINCLIVAANSAQGQVTTDGGPLECDALPAIRGEVDSIVQTLTAAREHDQGVGEVRLLDLSADDIEAADKLLETLESNRWDLVHFAGHSFICNGEPHLVLDPPFDVALGFERLALYLRRTRFLFISSCRSADHAFITKAIDSVIPQILGFRWPVKDAQAATFARSFYQSLFTLGKPSFKSIDYAFLAARCATHKSMPGDSAWASPILLTQTESK